MHSWSRLNLKPFRVLPLQFKLVNEKRQQERWERSLARYRRKRAEATNPVKKGTGKIDGKDNRVRYKEEVLTKEFRSAGRGGSEEGRERARSLTLVAGEEACLSWSLQAYPEKRGWVQSDNSVVCLFSTAKTHLKMRRLHVTEKRWPIRRLPLLPGSPIRPLGWAPSPRSSPQTSTTYS